MKMHRDFQDFVQDWWRRNEREFAERVKKEENRRLADKGVSPPNPGHFMEVWYESFVLNRFCEDQG
jgi:hypothetical protein